MLSTLYRVTAILLLCLFTFACATQPHTTKPNWAISKLPPSGGKNAAVGCSSHFNTPEQEKEARTFALVKLAEAEGAKVTGKTDVNIKDNDGVISSKIEVDVGTEIITTTISAVLQDTWRDPRGDEFCVWMKRNDTEVEGLWELLKKWTPVLLKFI